MFLIFASLPEPSLSAPPHPCHSACGETAGIIQPSSAHPEGCDSEFLCQVYFDIDKKLYAAAAGQWEAEGVRKCCFLFPMLVSPERGSQGVATAQTVSKWNLHSSSLQDPPYSVKSGNTVVGWLESMPIWDLIMPTDLEIVFARGITLRWHDHKLNFDPTSSG